MGYANTVASVLLLVSAVGAVCHHTTSAPAHKLRTSLFLTTEGYLQPVRSGLARRRSARRATAPSFHPRGPVYTVTATAYQAVEAQTDDEPFVTADNSFIEPNYSSKLRWLAVSQDLLSHWGGRIKYGDQVHVRGVSPELDGVYTVHDTMNRRHKHCIDILSHPREKLDIFAKGVKIQLVAALPVPQPRLGSLAARQANANRPAPLAKGGRTGRPKTTTAGYLTASIL